jgi:hypothetical protein
MSAAMVNVGLMWESRFPIRNVTAQCLRLHYGRCNGTAPRRLGRWSPRLSSLYYAAFFAQPSAAMARQTI